MDDLTKKLVAMSKDAPTFENTSWFDVFDTFKQVLQSKIPDYAEGYDRNMQLSDEVKAVVVLKFLE